MTSQLTFVLIVAVAGLHERRAWATPADAQIAGAYKYVGGPAEVKALLSAIEPVVKKMSWVSRGIARSRLRKGNLPTQEMRILIDAGAIHIVRPGRPTVAAPADGRSQKWKSSDGVFDVTHAFKDGRLIQTIDGKNSHSTNEFVLAGDGVTLTVHTRITSPRLPGAVVFRMTYRKK